MEGNEGTMQLPEWEGRMIEDAIAAAELRRDHERRTATRRAEQLAREQGYHRLACAIDAPAEAPAGQLSLWPTELTLFDEAG